jgi:hypothetical protein
MLVQLDTGDIAHLEQLSVRDEARFQDLVRAWNANGLGLALNLHHAQEIAQLEKQESRDRRLQTIGAFERIYFGGMAEFGVIRQEVAVLLDSIGNQEPARFDTLRDQFFPISSAAEFGAFLLSNLEKLRQMRVPIERSAFARNLGPKNPSRKRLKNRKLGQDSRAMAEQRFEKQLIGSELTADERGLALDVFLGVAASFEGQPNLRSALERHFGLLGVSWVHMCPDSDLSLAASFVDTSRELLAAGRGLFPPSPTEGELISGLNPYASPASRIQMALNRAQDAAGVSEPAHETDRSHAVFAPYVDVAFVDRQTASFLSQESRRAPNLLPRNDLASVRPSGSIEAVVETVLASRKSAI